MSSGGWIVRDAAEIDALREGWESVTGPDAPPTEWFCWTRVAARVFHPGRSLAVVGVGPVERPRALAPLVRAGRTPFRPYWQLGAAELTEPADLPHADPQAADELARALVTAGLPVLLRRVPADSPTVTALRRASSRRGLVHVRPDVGAPYLDLDQGWSEPLARLSSSRRGSLRRARRRAGELGTVTAECRSPGPDDLPAALTEALDVEARGWKGRGGTALARDPRRGAFFRAWAAETSAAGRLRLGFLRIDGRAVAMQIAAEAGGHHWILKIGHDESVSRCSPGGLLTAEMIADAARRGLTRYEFLGWPAPWIEAWTGTQHALSAVAFTPARPRGAVAFMPEVLREVRRRRRVREPA